MTDEATKGRRGCFFYGAVVGGLLLLVILVATFVGLSVAKRMLNEFTDTKPAQLPAVHLSQPQIDALQQRVSSFQLGIQQHRPAAPLALTADEVNALIATNPAMKPFKGKIYVMIEEGQLKGLLSVPLEEVGLPVFRGRYLNGTATFNIELHEGSLRITVEKLVAKGKQLPGVYMDRIRRQNVAQNVNANSRASIALDQLEKIEVRDGKLVIIPKDSQ